MNEQFQLLAAALEEIDAQLVITSPEAVVGTLVSLLQKHQVQSVALGRDTLLSHLDLATVIEQQDIGVVPPPEEGWTPDEVQLWRDALAGVDAGITSALGIAVETGTMLLPPYIPDVRAVSLVPPLHLAVIEAESVVEDIASLFTRWQEKGTLQGSAVLVTGPSRTADIEKELVLGVHGPGALIVLLIVPNE